MTVTVNVSPPPVKDQRRVSIRGVLYLAALVGWVTTIVVMSILGLWKNEIHWVIDSWFFLAFWILSDSPKLLKKVVR